jgi:2-polyprenyl-6-methoxyphenol hydroxylase-like FAD-dependent oxidoreductase
MARKPLVLISGAGIAGLAMARAFDHLQIPYMILERDDAPFTRNQGYGLTILPETRDYLALPPVLPELNQQFVLMTEGYSSFTHEGVLLSIDLKEELFLKNVISRVALREELLNKVSREKVTWGARVTNFEPLEKGFAVQLQTKEGEQSIVVDNIIASDGINSFIRQ